MNAGLFISMAFYGCMATSTCQSCWTIRPSPRTRTTGSWFVNILIGYFQRVVASRKRRRIGVGKACLNIGRSLSKTLDEIFDKEANWVAHRCNLHSCGPTCVKYSLKKRDAAGNESLYRFKVPWKIYNKTEFTEDGLFHVARNHSRVNRYNLSVDLRHNTDINFLPTNSSGRA